MLFDCLWGNVWWRASLLVLSVWFCGIVSIGVAFWVWWFAWCLVAIGWLGLFNSVVFLICVCVADWLFVILLLACFV